MTDNEAAFWAVRKDDGKVLRVVPGTASWEHVLRRGCWQRCQAPQPGQPWPVWDDSVPPLSWDGQAQELKRARQHRSGLARQRAARPRLVPGGPTTPAEPLRPPAGTTGAVPKRGRG